MNYEILAKPVQRITQVRGIGLRTAKDPDLVVRPSVDSSNTSLYDKVNEDSFHIQLRWVAGHPLINPPPPPSKRQENLKKHQDITTTKARQPKFDLPGPAACGSSSAPSPPPGSVSASPSRRSPCCYFLSAYRRRLPVLHHLLVRGPREQHPSRRTRLPFLVSRAPCPTIYSKRQQRHGQQTDVSRETKPNAHGMWCDTKYVLWT